MSDMLERVARAIDPGAFKAWQIAYDYEMKQSSDADEAKKFADWSSPLDAAFQEARAAIEAMREQWQNIETAPKDGTCVLLVRDNGCGWDYVTAWWGSDPTYRWQSDGNAHSEDRFDYWMPLPDPPD